MSISYQENISRLICGDLSLPLSSIIPHNVNQHIYTPAILELFVHVPSLLWKYRVLPACYILGKRTESHINFVFLFFQPSMTTAYSRGDDFLLVPFQSQKSIVSIIFLHDPSKLESLSLSSIDSLGPDSSLFWGPSLCIVRCLAALLASIQQNLTPITLGNISRPFK